MYNTNIGSIHIVAIGKILCIQLPEIVKTKVKWMRNYGKSRGKVR